MLTIAISDVRDLVLVLWGAVSILLTLIVLIVVAAILWFGRKGTAALHRLLNERGVPQLARVQKLADQVRDRTARLPGAPGSEAGPGELISAVQELKEIEPPFRRRIKSWRPF